YLSYLRLVAPPPLADFVSEQRGGVTLPPSVFKVHPKRTVFELQPPRELNVQQGWVMDYGTEPSLPLDIPEHSEVMSGQEIGYARVSSKDQNLERQTAALKKEKCFRIFDDTVSGSSTDRPGLDGALNYVRPGDQLVVTSMDRLARSLIDLHRLVDDLTARDVSVKFLKEGQTYSLNSTPIAKLMLGLL